VCGSTYNLPCGLVPPCISMCTTVVNVIQHRTVPVIFLLIFDTDTFGRVLDLGGKRLTAKDGCL